MITVLSIEASQSTPYAPLCALGRPVTTLSVSPRQGVRASLWSWGLLSWLDWWGEGASSGRCGRRGGLPAGSRALPLGLLIPCTLLLLVLCPPFLIPYDLLTPSPRARYSSSSRAPPSSSHTTYSPLTPSTLLVLSPSGWGIGQSLPSLGREVSRSPEPPGGLVLRGGLPRSGDILLEGQQKGIPQLFIEHRTLLGGASHQAPSPERLIGR